MGLEPTPGPWQGPVLPLYYDRPDRKTVARERCGGKFRSAPEIDSVQSSLRARAPSNPKELDQFTRLEARAQSSPRATSVAVRQTLQPFRDPCRHGQSVRRLCRTQ
jgi:hypothetical protein